MIVVQYTRQRRVFSFLVMYYSDSVKLIMLVLQFLEDSDTSLMLSLNHPLAPVRLLAVNHLKTFMKTSKVCANSFYFRFFPP
jgi:hypothetical protein